MFSRFVKYDSHQFAVAKGSHGLLKFIVQVKRTYFFFRGQRRLFDKETFFRVEKTVLAYFSWYYLRCCWKHNYLKKAIFPVETFFWPSYLVLWSNKVEKPQWTIYNRPFCFLTFFCAIYNFIWLSPVKPMRIFFKNAILLMILICFLSYYWVYIRKQFFRLKIRFKQFLCKLQDHNCNNWVNDKNQNSREKVTFSMKKKLWSFLS